MKYLYISLGVNAVLLCYIFYIRIHTKNCRKEINNTLTWVINTLQDLKRKI